MCTEGRTHWKEGVDLGTVFAFRPHTGQEAPYWPSYDTEEGDDVAAKYDSLQSKHDAIVACGQLDETNQTHNS